MRLSAIVESSALAGAASWHAKRDKRGRVGDPQVLEDPTPPPLFLYGEFRLRIRVRGTLSYNGFPLLHKDVIALVPLRMLGKGPTEMPEFGPSGHNTSTFTYPETEHGKEVYYNAYGDLDDCK